jgi:hypothetical protein
MPDLAPQTVDPELTEAVGRVVIRWSSLEYWISLLLATLLKADHGGMMIVTNNIPVSTQSRWLRALMARHEHEAEHNARVVDLLNRADDLRAERNEVVHGIWDTTSCEPHTALIQTVNLERAEVIRERLITLHDLNQLVIEIDQWIADYIELGRELGFPRRPGETKSIFAD